MKGRCEYTEKAVADCKQVLVFQFGGWAEANNPSPQNNSVLKNATHNSINEKCKQNFS
jgi:hypothetical protein